MSYDNRGRLQCSAVRMNTAAYGSLPADACTLGTAGSFGQDRITKAVYDAADEVTQVQQGVGTTDAATERTLTYTDNGLVSTLKDAENNLTTFAYDGFDRWSKTRYPNPTKGSGTSSTTDYEQALVYDADSSLTSFRNRAGQTIGFAYDNLNRIKSKDLPGTEPDVTYAYDNLDRLTSASQSGNALSFGYDALSRNLTQAGPQGTVTSAWDSADRRTKLTYPDGYYVNFDYLVTGDVTKVRENGATSGIGVLATYAYDNLGRRSSTTFGNGVVQGFGFDGVSRLTSLSLDFTGTAGDLTISYGYNPASQIATTTRSNDLYAWTGHGSGSSATVTNGLNQLASVGGVSATHDANGNLTTDPATGLSFTYDSQNQLKSASGPTPPTLTYDPAGRLWEVAAGTGASRQAYDGVEALTTQDTSGTLFRRFVHGPGLDETIVQYEGAGATTRKFLAADDKGSIVAMSDDSGNVTVINTYDEYGAPGASNDGTFQHAGLMWQSLLGAYYNRARMYEPKLGRFLQPDPIGYSGDGPNLYAYVLDDPVNGVDPLGLCIGGGGSAAGNLSSPEMSITCPRLSAAGTSGGGTLALPPRFASKRTPLARTGRSGFDRRRSQQYQQQQRGCPSDKNISAALDGGMFLGRGVGGTIGFNWNAQSNRIRYFASVRIGKGVGFIIGGGVGPASSEPSTGTTSTYNIAAGLYDWGFTINLGGGQASFSGGYSQGPKYGAELSHTTNITAVADIYSGNQHWCTK